MRQGAIALAAACALLAAIAAVAVYAHTRMAADPPQGGVRIHTTDNGTVIADPWCMRSEDSCAMRFRPSGMWVLVRVTP